MHFLYLLGSFHPSRQTLNALGLSQCYVSEWHNCPNKLKKTNVLATICTKFIELPQQTQCYVSELHNHPNTFKKQMF